MSTSNKNNDQCGDSGEMKSNKKECTSCEQTDVKNITEGIDSVAIQDDISTCAACGKEGDSDDMNTCNKCKEVTYCNAACKKKHRSKHKKACEKRVAELHDEKLFKEVEPDECPICLLPLINGNQTETFQSCCGKVICNGCIYAIQMSEGENLCPYCRMPPAKSEKEDINRTKKLMDKGNAGAFYFLAGMYADGEYGMPKDRRKANELYLKGGELGCADAYYNLGTSYRIGRGGDMDMKKAKYYYELAAMNGSIMARNNLGWMEGQTDNHHRAMRHFVMAAKAGDRLSLNNVKKGFTKWVVTKDEYANTLRAYQKRREEMKSDERDKAAIYLGI